MLGEIGGKFGPAARVLVLELDARRPDRVGLRGNLHAGIRDQRCGLCRFVMELLALSRLGAVAAAGDYQRQSALGVSQAEMEGRKAAHRNSDAMGFLDGEPVEDGSNVVARPLLRITARVLRAIR